jgi:hypothetical protein
VSECVSVPRQQINFWLLRDVTFFVFPILYRAKIGLNILIPYKPPALRLYLKSIVIFEDVPVGHP